MQVLAYMAIPSLLDDVIVLIGMLWIYLLDLGLCSQLSYDTKSPFGSISRYTHP